MTERIDHGAEARQALEAAWETPADPSVVADPWLLAAQVHATLALVEQQRIANLIAWMGQQPKQSLTSRIPDAQITANSAIREGLGL